MSKETRPLGSDLRKIDEHVIQPEEYEEIPELTAEWFQRADHYEGGKLMRRGKRTRQRDEKALCRKPR